MRTVGVITLSIVAILFLVAATPSPPARWVEDHAGFLTPTVRDRLDAKLASYERVTGQHVVVWIERTLGGTPVAEWSGRTFSGWRSSRFDNGIAVFVFADDRVIDIEVGRELAARVPESTALHVIRDVMAPRLDADQRDAGITDGVDALLTSIDGRRWTAQVALSPVAAEVPWFRWGMLGVMAAVASLLVIASTQGIGQHRQRDHHRFGW